MSANNDSGEHIEHALAEIGDAKRVAKVQLKTLFEEAFEEAGHRFPLFLKLLHEEGNERAVATMDGHRGWAKQLYYVGPYKFFAGKKKINAALKQLPEAIATYRELWERERDMKQARSSLIRKRDEARLRDQTANRDISRKTARGNAR
ncbi:hypothetical protein QA648_36840 (plasmid) [Rhizobium sp. CB3171]|uniref:hypothetical protein n=1 Tax=Rhizobium sp. CB3171 TaxID=3039157 RepID=UPI0024B247C8|nr:hypothetical protein [Rhizobium sp. CB3171]WFU07547.1 hypothetical protein QA648_36840 [Rhizobium sp. CB3171]